MNANKSSACKRKQVYCVNGFELNWWFIIVIAHHHCSDESTFNHSTLYPHIFLLFYWTSSIKSNKHTSFVAYSINCMLSSATFRLAFLCSLLLNEHNTTSTQYNTIHANDLFAVFKIRFELENKCSIAPWVVVVMIDKHAQTLIDWYLVKHFCCPSISNDMQFGGNLYAFFLWWLNDECSIIKNQFYVCHNYKNQFTARITAINSHLNEWINGCGMLFLPFVANVDSLLYMHRIEVLIAHILWQNKAIIKWICTFTF